MPCGILDTLTLVDEALVGLSVPHPPCPLGLEILYKGDDAVFCSTPMADTYRQDEIQEILQIAIARHTTVDELSRHQLFEIAEELGLSDEHIQAAEQDWLLGKQVSREHQAFRHYRRVRFRQHLIKYGIINGFLMLFDLATYGDGTLTLSFSLYIALVWGLFLTLDGWRAMQTEGDDYERAFQRWKRRQWLQKSAQRLLGRWWPPSTALKGR